MVKILRSNTQFHFSRMENNKHFNAFIFENNRIVDHHNGAGGITLVGLPTTVMVLGLISSSGLAFFQLFYS